MREAKTQAKTRVMRSLIFYIYIYINFLEFTGYSLQITNAYRTWKSLARISCLIRSFERATELAGISVNSGIK